MISFVKGDILRAEVEALVNTVNCVGFMGRGIAAQFRRAFPENFKKYKAACDAKEMQPGKVFIVAIAGLTNPRYIVNFPTKRHWRGKSRLGDIGAGLADLVEQVERLEIRSIAIPALGCGLGKLRWEDVRGLIVEAFEKAPQVDVHIYPRMVRPMLGRWHGRRRCRR